MRPCENLGIPQGRGQDLTNMERLTAKIIRIGLAPPQRDDCQIGSLAIKPAESLTKNPSPFVVSEMNAWF